MQLLRDCSKSYTFPQVRATMAAAMLRELSHEQLQMLCIQLGWERHDLWGTSRQMAWRLSSMLLPGGNETRKKRRTPTPKQRRLPGTE